MKRIISSIFLLFAFLTGKTQTISLGGSITNFELLDDAQVINFNVPLVIKATDFANLNFPDTSPAFVQIGGTSDAKYCDGIKFTFDRTKSCLSVSVTLDSLPVQGIYTVNIKYTTNKLTDKIKIYNLLIFNILRPSATLESLNTVTITAEGCEPIQVDPISIHETSNHTPVRDLKFYDPIIQGKTIPGLLKFDSDSKFIGHGEQKSIKFKVDSVLLKK
ncbi:hypothetical protein [Mucilaginibacter psychrotolerans]|uniref:Uncharacterized protein n=1 Tax=Mucilaginibacter psychrotolerans TaxID=1524096 RepID=A0A4Y8RXQ9_9SPHI|nr:hypothetical protein [Mucilaginibacter psychrotolerans]TFF29722.1 hypothetical protein E2R66_28025 [Mucilaginibacter psychrotolerans]